MVGILLMAALVAWLFLRWRGRQPIMLSRSSLAFVALAAASVVTSLTADFPGVSLEASARLVSSALLFVVLEQVLRDRPDLIRPLLVAVFASLLVPAIVAGFQWYGNVPEVPMYGPAIDVGRIRGTFVHPNAFASHLVILIPLAVALVAVVRGWARTWLVVTGAVSALLLLFTYARGAWIACLLAVLVVGWLQDRRIVWLVVAATVVAPIAIPSVSTRLSDLSEDDNTAIVGDPDSLEWRLGYWVEVLPRTMEGPITGIGLGSIEHSSPLRLAPHNVFVQTLVEMGLAGLTALLFLIASLAVDLKRALRRASPGLDRAAVAGAVGVSIGLLVQCLSENLLNGTMVQMYSLVPLAWATRRSPVAVLVGGPATPSAVRSAA
jgi:putative inorganic carbon (hco3(-)) transporter